MNVDGWPAVIEWRITGACNERCAFCYGPSHQAVPKRPAVEQLLRVLGECPTPVIRITGGEPLLYPGIDGVMAALASRFHKRVVLSTNGWRAEAHYTAIVEYVAKLNLPLEGGDPSTHARSSRSDSSFDDVIGLLQRLATVAERPYVKIGTVVSALSPAVGYLRDVYDILQPLPVDRWKVYQFVPVGPIADKSLVVPDVLYERHIADLRRHVAARGLRPLELVAASASSRDSAYCLVEPNGDVCIPVGGSMSAVQLRVGNLLTEEPSAVVRKWQSHANMENHLNNAWIHDNADRK